MKPHRPFGWRFIPLVRLQIAFERGAIDWWNNPASTMTCIRSNKSGRVYDFIAKPGLGFLMRINPQSVLNNDR